MSSASAAIEGPRGVVETRWPWVLRALWIALPFLVGPIIGSVVDGRSQPVRVVVVVLAWLWWTAGLLATLVAHPAGLVALRVTPAPMFAVLISVLSPWGSHRESRPTHLAVGLAVVVVILVAFAVCSSETGHWCVNGPAYANERRFLLRPSAVALLGPIPIAAAIVAAGVSVGPVIVAARNLPVGIALTAVGLALAWVAARALYAQARRFVVFVPAGFVVHDREVLREPVLFLRRFVEGIRPAPADSDSLDLTANAPGLAIEILLTEKVEVTKVKHSRDQGKTGRTARFLVVPTLPGRLLATAAERRFPVG